MGKRDEVLKQNEMYKKKDHHKAQGLSLSLEGVCRHIYMRIQICTGGGWCRGVDSPSSIIGGQ